MLSSRQSTGVSRLRGGRPLALAGCVTSGRSGGVSGMGAFAFYSCSSDIGGLAQSVATKVVTLRYAHIELTYHIV